MCSEQPQLHFWNETFLLESEMLAFVHSIRIADFQLYCESLTKLLPMFAMDHTSYARWATVHVMDMLTLEEQHPTLYNKFIQGGFTVQKTDRLFSNICGSRA